jgi:maltose/moltooligosaccharide transporter
MSSYTLPKRKLSFWEIWNMSFGFLGIQFGFALQGGNMSRIFQTLGAEPDDVPMLWIAAPLTGLIVQPIIGYLSDRTWSPRWGRRRPYFLLGAVLSSLALFFVPYSSALWMAAGFLWILDASINISMEPFRALVADKLGEEQRSYGFVMQTLIIGIGTWVASNLPLAITRMGEWVAVHWPAASPVLTFSNEAPAGQIPPSVFAAFAVGAIVFLASILFTVLKTTEEPPADWEAFEAMKQETRGLEGAKSLFRDVLAMPRIMRSLGAVQFFSWFAFFTMWAKATPALTAHVFRSPNPSANDPLFAEKIGAYNDAADAVSAAMGTYGLSSMAFALLLTVVASRSAINRKAIHATSLLLGGAGFATMALWAPDSAAALNLSFALIGIAWGSILSMPYAMLSGGLPEEKMGTYMGIFNMFIVIPQIVAALGGINLLQQAFGATDIAPMLLAGASLAFGGLATLRIREHVAAQ